MTTTTNTTISSDTLNSSSTTGSDRAGTLLSLNETNNSSQSSLYDYFDVYDKPDCRVSSNDLSRSEKTIQSALKICNFTQYTCISSLVGADTRVPVQVPYEYELHYNANMMDDLNTRILPFLEESMLQQIANTLGIAQCRERRLRLERRQRRTRRYRHLQLQPSVTQGRFTEETGRFAGASLEPRDVWNDRCGNCMANNGYVADGDECLPIRGEMTVLVQLTPQEQAQQLVVTEDDKETIRDAVAMFIKEAMDNDALVVSDYIAKVVYIGDKESKCGGGVLAVDAIAANGGLNGGNGGWSKAFRIGLWSGLVLLLLLLLFCCCCCFCCRRRKRRRRQEQQQVADTSPNDTTSTRQVNQQRSLSRGGVNSTSGRRSPSRSVVTPAPYWGTLSVDDDGEDGVERCLAGRDSLALRQGHSESSKPTYDDESVGTTRTSLASGSLVQPDSPNSPRDVPVQPEGKEIETLDESIDQIPKEITRRVAGEERVNLETPLIKSSNIKAEDFELLDRLAAPQRPWSDLSLPGEGKGGSIHTRDFLAAASLSPTNASQVTALASNLQHQSSHWKDDETMPTAHGRAYHASMSGNESNSRAIEAISRGAIDLEQPSTPSVESRSSLSHIAAPDLAPIVTTGFLTANLTAQATSNRSTQKSKAMGVCDGDETDITPVSSPRTPTRAARDEKAFSLAALMPPYGRTDMTSSPPASPRTPTRAGSETAFFSVASPRTPTRLETIEPAMMYSPQTPKGSMSTISNHAIDAEIRAFAGNIRYPRNTTSNSRTSQGTGSVEGDESSSAGVAPKTFRSSTISRSRDAPLPPVQPENHETYTYTPPQHTFSPSAYYQRSSTYGSQVTAVAGNLASSTYGSHTTLRTGNLGPRQGGSNTRQMTAAPYLEEDEEYEDGETAYVPDSFDEEIMGIITEDPSEDNLSEEVVHLTNPDILDGHDAYPDPDGPGMNDAYLSDDSDSVPLPMPEHHYRSVAGTAVADEHAKRRLQMS